MLFKFKGIKKEAQLSLFSLCNKDFLVFNNYFFRRSNTVRHYVYGIQTIA